MKRYFLRWSKIAPMTLLIVSALLIGFFVVNAFVDFDRRVFAGIILAEIIIIGYSFFSAIWNVGDMPPAYDAVIIKNAFDGSDYNSKAFRRAYKILSEGNVPDALDCFTDLKNAELKGRQRAVLLFFIGRCYQFMGYPTNAAHYFKECVEAGIGVDEVYTLCGRELTACGDFSSAETIFNELISRNARSEFVYTDMGMLYIKANEPDKALDTFSRSIKQHMNYAFALGGCALAYILKKDPANARFFYSQAILNNIDDADGFTDYYISVAETQGLSDEIGIKPKPKLYFDPTKIGAAEE